MTPPRPAARYEPAYDGIRAIAILLVVAFHLDVPWTTGGFLGVDLFFVLSGFLITSRLAEELARTGRIHFRMFYARRALRLLPALFLVLVAGTVWAQLFFPVPLRETTTRGAVSAALYFANWLNIRSGEHALGAFGHMWSLSIEEQFYAVWPLLLLLLFRFRHRPAIVATAGVVLAASRAVMAIAGVGVWRLYNGFDTHSDGLMLGAVLALVVTGGELPASVRRLAPIASIVGLAALIAFVPWVTYQQRRTYVAIIPFVNAIAAAWIVAGSMREPTLIGHLLRARPMRWLGRISYSLYLWHLPVLIALQYPPLDRVPVAAGILAATGLASLSYYGFERPALQLKRYFQPASNSVQRSDR